MTIAPATVDDFQELCNLHARMGLDYVFPDLADGTFLSVTVVRDDTGRIVMALAARRVAEMFFLLDSKWETPGMRYSWFKRLSAVMERKLQTGRVKDVHALVPPQVQGAFGRRLKALGWWKPTWSLWAKSICK